MVHQRGDRIPLRRGTGGVAVIVQHLRPVIRGAQRKRHRNYIILSSRPIVRVRTRSVSRVFKHFHDLRAGGSYTTRHAMITTHCRTLVIVRCALSPSGLTDRADGGVLLLLGRFLDSCRCLYRISRFGSDTTDLFTVVTDPHARSVRHIGFIPMALVRITQHGLGTVFGGDQYKTLVLTAVKDIESRITVGLKCCIAMRQILRLTRRNTGCLVVLT